MITARDPFTAGLIGRSESWDPWDFLDQFLPDKSRPSIGSAAFCQWDDDFQGFTRVVTIGCRRRWIEKPSGNQCRAET